MNDIKLPNPQAPGTKITPAPEKKPIKLVYDYLNEVAYTIADKHFPGGEFKVWKTANGWWGDRRKVEDLITAFKIDCTVEEACHYAGISKGNLEYFLQRHPDFLGVIEACRDLPIIKARDKVIKAIDSDPEMALKYLERKRKSEFGPKVDISALIMPVKDVNIKIDYGNGPASIQSDSSIRPEPARIDAPGGEPGGDSE
jgi:hypothetical protein